GAEFPILVAVRPEPVARIIVPFIGITNSYVVTAKCPELFDESVIQFFGPFALEECLSLFPAVGALGPVAPTGVQAVGLRYFCRVASIPAVLCLSNFLYGGRFSKRR